MIERIRISLWDIFTYFLTGFLAFAIGASLALVYGPITAQELGTGLIALPPAIVIVAAPLGMTLAGLLVEPFANYCDRYVLNYLLFPVARPKDKHTSEETILADLIRSKYLGDLNDKIESPYAICKEYVETKALSTTFMVFLSRYGFYRNCAFLSLGTGIALAALNESWFGRLGALIALLLIAAAFKRRAEDFYSYMAPAVYRAFLIDKLDWNARGGA